MEGTENENTLLKVSTEFPVASHSYSIQWSRDTFFFAPLKQEMRKQAAELTGSLHFGAVIVLFQALI